ncbi:MAG: hypothetical protein PHQ00_01285 [Phycisphaerae bacterium]|nr:hypothetical protein [Phycisphaerae bacterium]
MCKLDMKQVVPIEEMAGRDKKDIASLKEMLKEAENYLKSFKWCPEIEKIYFGFGIGGVIAVFLFKFKEKIQETDEFLWVVVGDLPPAYFVVDEASNPKEAIETYCELMEDWVNAVRNKTSLKNVYPVVASPTEEHAQMLSSRIKLLREDIIPQYGKECEKKFY